MKQRTKNSLIVVTLLITILAIITPIVWDQYLRKAALELHYLGSIELIEDPILEKLKILYDGKQISNLTKHEFLLINSGQTPITQSDIVEPLEISSSNIQEILKVNLTSSTPENLAINLSTSENKDALIIDFPLLNPGDSAVFSVLSIGGKYGEFTVSARIVNIGNIEIINEKLREKGWQVPGYKIFFIILIIIQSTALFSFVKELMKDISIMNEFNTDGFEIVKPNTVDGYKDFIKKYFSGKSKSEMADIRTLQLQFEPTDAISEGRHKQFVEVFHNTANDLSRSWIFLFIGIISIAFNSLFLFYAV